MWYLVVSNGKLKTLPSTIGKLEKLKELHLASNEIERLPTEIGELKSLEKLVLKNNQLISLHPAICNLGSLKELNVEENVLVSFPDCFDKMISLVTLHASKNNLSSLPESIGRCENLETIYLDDNDLESLPKSMGTSKIKHLYLRKNKFDELPYVLWPLDVLETFLFEDNPLSEEEKQMVKRDMDTLRDYLKQRASMAIFVSHAVIDYEAYQLAALGEYLEAKPEVYDVLLCEQDLSGNIDDFMDQNVPISDVVFFLGTNKSVFNSVDCTHELELSEKHKVPVLPMKGTDVSWEDINSVGLSQPPGIVYDPQDFERVCEQIYEYVKQFYAQNRIFKVKRKEEIEITIALPTEIDWDIFIGMVEKILESDRLRQFHANKKNELAGLISQLKSGTIDDANFIMQISQLYSQWLMMQQI
jgi:hypothetical protein